MSIEYSSVIHAPLQDVFAYHERPGALSRLFPPWVPASLEAETISLFDGEAVIRFPGGIRWVARHRATSSPFQFVDELVSFPLKWRHTHTFTDLGDSVTRVTDNVETPVPSRFLRSMFRYRHDQLAGDMAAHIGARALGEPGAAPLSITIGMTGAGGLVGSALRALLSTGGHRVIRFVRRPAQAADEKAWNPRDPKSELFEGLDAVVHLAGASIAGRFTQAHKEAIRESRVAPTAQLARAIARCDSPPAVLVTASAIGFYGADRGDELLNEDSGRGSGFLAGVVDDWEGAASPAKQAGIRVVHVRTGIVQSPRGGVLRVLWPIFELGAGGRLGTGDQWLSWIDLDDLCDIYYRALVDARLQGPINAVAPEPVRNRDFTATLAKVLRRPAVLHVPAAAPRLLLGAEGAAELAFANQRVTPGRLNRLGHRFRWPSLEASLRHQLGRRDSAFR